MTNNNDLTQKCEFLQQQALTIIELAETTKNSALNCLHQINTLGGATEKAYKTVQQRIINDQDSLGAYHAIAMAQHTSDLPFDVPILLEILYKFADAELLFRLLKLFKNQPKIAEPIPSICQAIQKTDDQTVIYQMNDYLAQKK